MVDGGKVELPTLSVKTHSHGPRSLYVSCVDWFHRHPYTQTIFSLSSIQRLRDTSKSVRPSVKSFEIYAAPHACGLKDADAEEVVAWPHPTLPSQREKHLRLARIKPSTRPQQSFFGPAVVGPSRECCTQGLKHALSSLEIERQAYSRPTERHFLARLLTAAWMGRA